MIYVDCHGSRRGRGLTAAVRQSLTLPGLQAVLGGSAAVDARDGNPCTEAGFRNSDMSLEMWQEIACGSVRASYRRTMIDGGYYTADELMAHLGKNRRQLKALRERCGLPHWRPEGAAQSVEYLYPCELVDAWEQRGLCQPPVAGRARRSDAGKPIEIAPRRRVGAVGVRGLATPVYSRRVCSA